MKTRKIVRTHKNDHGIVVFRLMQGRTKMRTVHTFGYGTCHRIWLRMHELGKGQVMVTAVPEEEVKEQIASWRS